MSDKSVVESGPAKVNIESEQHFTTNKNAHTMLYISTHLQRPALKEVMDEKHMSFKNFLKKDWDELDSRNPMYIKYLGNFEAKTGVQHSLQAPLKNYKEFTGLRKQQDPRRINGKIPYVTFEKPVPNAEQEGITYKKECVQKVLKERIAATNRVKTEKRMASLNRPRTATVAAKHPNLVAQQLKDSNVAHIFASLTKGD